MQERVGQCRLGEISELGEDRRLQSMSIQASPHVLLLGGLTADPQGALRVGLETAGKI